MCEPTNIRTVLFLRILQFRGRSEWCILRRHRTSSLLVFLAFEFLFGFDSGRRFAVKDVRQHSKRLFWFELTAECVAMFQVKVWSRISRSFQCGCFILRSTNP